MGTEIPIDAAMKKRSGALLSYLSLFTSLGTLLCCALPSLLVLFGLGATVASFLTAVPWLVTLLRHKSWVFLISGLLIAVGFLYVYRIAPKLKAHGETCSIEVGQAACDAATRLSHIVLWIAAAIYAIGFFPAFVLGPLLARTG
ncbi:MAG TPA: hypothetical protein VHX36_09530 [Candidatus Acidoferrales bacterium]|jgi:uncharacterized membrane protein (UPF0136 family)|nr:hypothetical protein [Candidatus Acidoferrales bacterium]